MAGRWLTRVAAAVAWIFGDTWALVPSRLRRHDAVDVVVVTMPHTERQRAMNRRIGSWPHRAVYGVPKERVRSNAEILALENRTDLPLPRRDRESPRDHAYLALRLAYVRALESMRPRAEWILVLEDDVWVDRDALRTYEGCDVMWLDGTALPTSLALKGMMPVGSAAMLYRKSVVPRVVQDLLQFHRGHWEYDRNIVEACKDRHYRCCYRPRGDQRGPSVAARVG